jgi:hypothetical protein
MAAMRYASLVSVKCVAAFGYVLSGTNPFVSIVIASVSSMAVILQVQRTCRDSFHAESSIIVRSRPRRLHPCCAEAGYAVIDL